MKGIDFAGLLRVGLQHLQIQPGDFWRLSPVELAVLLGVSGQGAPMDRQGLEALLRAYPDTKGGTPHV